MTLSIVVTIRGSEEVVSGLSKRVGLAVREVVKTPEFEQLAADFHGEISGPRIVHGEIDG